MTMNATAEVDEMTAYYLGRAWAAMSALDEDASFEDAVEQGECPDSPAVRVSFIRGFRSLD